MKQIVFEVRVDGRLRGFVERYGENVDGAGGGVWRWVAIDAPLQGDSGYPTWDEAMSDLLEAIGAWS